MADDFDLIAAIYGAALDPQSWEGWRTPSGLVEAAKSGSGTLFSRQPDAPHISALHNIDLYWANAFVENWHNHNPLLSAAAIFRFSRKSRGCCRLTQTPAQPRRSRREAVVALMRTRLQVTAQSPAGSLPAQLGLACEKIRKYGTA